MSQLSVSPHGCHSLRPCRNALRPFEAIRKPGRAILPKPTCATSQDASNRRDILLATGGCPLQFGSPHAQCVPALLGALAHDTCDPGNAEILCRSAGGALLLSAGGQLSAPQAAYSETDPDKRLIKVQYLSAIAKNSQKQAFKVRTVQANTLFQCYVATLLPV